MPDTPEYEPHVVMARPNQMNPGHHTVKKGDYHELIQSALLKPLLTVPREQAAEGLRKHATAKYKSVLCSWESLNEEDKIYWCRAVDYMCSVRVESAPQSPVTEDEAVSVYNSAIGFTAGIQAILALCASRGVKQAPKAEEGPQPPKVDYLEHRNTCADLEDAKLTIREYKRCILTLAALLAEEK